MNLQKQNYANFMPQFSNMYRSALIILVIAFFAGIFLSCETKIKEDDQLIKNLMETEMGKFQRILQNKDSFEVQVIYTQINRDENNYPHFKSFYFNVDSARYFYPASTVKLPLVLLSLEKLISLILEG